MRIPDLSIEVVTVPSVVPAWRTTVNAEQWRQTCQHIQESGGRLVALWGSEMDGGYIVHVALACASGMVCLELPLSKECPTYPDVSDIFIAARRMQRATYDLLGMDFDSHGDKRPWLRHGAWPKDWFPLRRESMRSATFDAHVDDYNFVTVAGEGVHEIPVGPVHAGIIEPGHFRFQVVGEKLLRLEEHLGYKHKGIEKLFQDMTYEQGARLAGRISGDSTVAYAWAYAMAVEGVVELTIPPRAMWLRALLLECERIMNHLGDLGALGNDGGFAFGLTQFLRLKEEVLRTNDQLFQHRYLMDTIIPGGVSRNLDSEGKEILLMQTRYLEGEVARLKDIYDEHAGLQDRFLTTGKVAPELAARLGLCGLAGRASSQAWDLRCQFPCAPYDALDVQMATHRNGDVAARVIVRFEEIAESLRLITNILKKLPEGEISISLPDNSEERFGVGWVEGWRGDVFVALSAGPGNTIRRLHPHDPSWQNWPALEYAVIDNIVPDFPLINKSFNLSYSGHDL